MDRFVEDACEQMEYEYKRKRSDYVIRIRRGRPRKIRPMYDHTINTWAQLPKQRPDLDALLTASTKYYKYGYDADTRFLALCTFLQRHQGEFYYMPTLAVIKEYVQDDCRLFSPWPKERLAQEAITRIDAGYSAKPVGKPMTVWWQGYLQLNGVARYLTLTDEPITASFGLIK